MKQRNSALELPDVHEILDIVRNKESSRRAARTDWIENNIEVFEPFREMCRLLRVEDIFEFDRCIADELGLARAVALQERMKRDVGGALQEHIIEPELLRAVYDTLAKVDDPTSSDAIFVFGAPSNTRIDKAVELFYEGLANKIVVSGRGPNWEKDHTETEARRMAQRAESLSVPPEKIILEEQSITVPDNVKRTLDTFDAIGYAPGKIIIVTSAFAMLRSYLGWVRFPEKPIEIVCVAAPIVDEQKGPDLWHTNSNGINTVLNEYAKIIGEACVDNLLHNSKE